MARLLLSLFFCLTSTLSFILLLISSININIVEAMDQAEFDYFLLALQWPGTACQSVSKCCSSNGCCRSDALPYFTIHGLWPDYNKGGGPSCCSNAEFDEDKISTVLPDLEKYWPSFSCSKTSLCSGGKGLFWAHEWEKHGTCASPVIEDEYTFFSTEVLIAGGIVASDSKEYAAVDIVSAVENGFGASPLLVCRSGKLYELRICFDKELKPRECTINGSETVDIALEGSSCLTNISLPTYTTAAHVSEMNGAFVAWSAGL